VHTSTPCFKKSNDTLIFLNNSVKNEPNLVIFGIWNPEETSYQMFINGVGRGMWIIERKGSFGVNVGHPIEINGDFFAYLCKIA